MAASARRSNIETELKRRSTTTESVFGGCLQPLAALLIGVALLLSSDASASEEAAINPTGQRLYREHCSRCHGDKGQGNPEEVDGPLSGDRSIKSLSGLIHRTMPEDEPEAVRDDAARQVAEYIFDAFYSPAAQARIQPPARLELTRLTVNQYRNSVADLVGAFSARPETGPHEPEPGLSAEYFQSKGMSKANQLKMEQVDPAINFDFGESGPSKDIAPDQFAAVWNGVLQVPDTGYHEFRITTQNGARLYLNAENTGQRSKMRDDSSLAGQEALIDGWVSSGTMREHKARIFLLGGREYPLRLEFFKYKEKTASIRFEWKMPHSTWQILDQRFLRTGSVPRTFVVSTPFPPDDRSTGYERGSAVSTGWYHALTQGAIETATEIINRLPHLAGDDGAESDRQKVIRQFVEQLASVAYRRPLNGDERRFFGEQVFLGAANPEVGVRRAVLAMLTSPSFLYPDPSPQSVPNAHQVASRLALTMWDSIPDGSLRAKAEADQIQTHSSIRTEVERLISDRRTRDKVRRFFFHWLEIEDRDWSKDPTLFPEFSDAVVADLRYSLEQMVEGTVWGQTSDYRELLLTDKLFLNQPLRQLYAPDRQDVVSLPPGEFEAVSLPDQRSGILTHPYLLSAFSYHNSTSPIHRGVFLTRNVMGRSLKPPPEAVSFKNEDFPADLSMREKITQITRDAACMNCHSVINPLGFALENFDAVGRWRNTEHDQLIETQSQYPTEGGDTETFHRASDLARYAVRSPTAHRAFVRQLFRYLTKQEPAAYGSETLETLRLHFVANQFSIRSLIEEIALVAATQGLDQTPRSNS